MRTPIVMLIGAARSGKDTAGAVLARELGGVCIALADPIKRFLADPEGLGLSTEQLWGSKKEEMFLRRAPTVGTLLALVETHFGVDDPDVVGEIEEAIETWTKGLPNPTTPRHVMQTFGTDCIRESIDPDFWVNQGLEIAENLLLGYGWYEREKGIVDEPEGSARPPYNAVVITDGRFRNEALPVKQVGGYLARIVRPGLTLTGAAAAHASETEQKSIPNFWCDAVLPNDSTLEAFQLQCQKYADHLSRR